MEGPPVISESYPLMYEGIKLAANDAYVWTQPCTDK